MTTHPNEALIKRFYDAFAAKDADAMAACYAPDVTFTDPAFGTLHGAEASGMWRMLVGRSADLSVVASAITASDTAGSAHWTAHYTFSTGRKVVNEIDAVFTFENGLIKTHVDSFDLWKWSRQALGPVGLLLGWSPIIRKQVQGKARAQLDKYLAAQS